MTKWVLLKNKFILSKVLKRVFFWYHIGTNILHFLIIPNPVFMKQTVVKVCLTCCCYDNTSIRFYQLGLRHFCSTCKVKERLISSSKVNVFNWHTPNSMDILRSLFPQGKLIYSNTTPLLPFVSHTLQVSVCMVDISRFSLSGSQAMESVLLLHPSLNQCSRSTSRWEKD